jgi:membrane protein YdbS with pleckstrin-like domain
MESNRNFTEDEIFRFLDMLSSKAARAAFNGVVYAASLSYLGAAWRGILVGAIAFILFMVGYGARWIERGGFALIVLAMLVWLGIVPEAKNWLGAVEATVTRLRGAP